MTTPETQVTLFKNRNGNCNVALRVGGVIAFVNGRFFTTKAALQQELQAAADNDHEYGIYVDPAEPSIDPNCATPMDQLRKKLREELMAELKAGGQLVDAGLSTTGLTQQAIATSSVVPGQGGVSDELAKLQEAQKEVVTEASDTRTPAQIQLDKLKAGNK